MGEVEPDAGTRAEAVGLDVGAFDGASVRVLGKGNKERSVPVEVDPKNWTTA